MSSSFPSHLVLKVPIFSNFCIHPGTKAEACWVHSRPRPRPACRAGEHVCELGQLAAAPMPLPFAVTAADWPPGANDNLLLPSAGKTSKSLLTLCCWEQKGKDQKWKAEGTSAATSHSPGISSI